MLSLSLSARMLAPRLVAASLAPAAVAVATPRVLLHSRGLATSTAEYPTPAASAARPAAAATASTASKEGKKADAPKKAAAPKKTAAPKKAATSGRGARRTNKTQPSAASAARAATRQVKQAKRDSAMQMRQAKAAAARDARRLRAQLKREKKQTLLQAKAARRMVAIAKNRERIAKMRELQAQAYFVRVNGEVMRSNPGFDITQVGSKIGEQWRALSESDKAPLVATYNKEVAEWKDKLAAWVEANPGAHLVRFNKPSMTSVRKEIKEAQAIKTTKATKAGAAKTH